MAHYNTPQRKSKRGVQAAACAPILFFLTPLLRALCTLPEREPRSYERQREQRHRRAQAQRAQRAVIVLAAAAILLALAATLVKHHARKQAVVLVIRAPGMVQ